MRLTGNEVVSRNRIVRVLIPTFLLLGAGGVVLSWWFWWAHFITWMPAVVVYSIMLHKLRSSSPLLVAGALPHKMIVGLSNEATNWLNRNGHALVMWGASMQMGQHIKHLIAFAFFAIVVTAFRHSWWWLLELFILAAIMIPVERTKDWAGNAGVPGLASARLFFLRVSSAILIWMAAIASAATYYIDQTAGSDSNNGASAGTPWKNAPGMRAASDVAAGTVLKPGDTVYFDRGDTWLVSAPAGGQGLYLVGGVTYLGDSWGTGARATLRASGNLDCGVVRFRDSATYPTIFKGFDVDANRTVSTGVDINHANYSLMTGATKRVENVTVRNVFSNGSLGQYKYGIIVSNWGGDQGIVENVEILGCTVHDTSRTAIALYPGPGVLNRIGNILVRGCEAYNTGQDPSYPQGHGIVIKGWVYNARIENNYVHVDSGAVFLSGPDGGSGQRSAQNVIVRNNILTAKDNTGIIRLYNPGAKDIKIYGNLIFDSGVGGGLNLGGNSGSLNLLVYNNTFHNAFVELGGSSATVNALEFKNNIVAFASAQLRNPGALTSQSNNILTSGNPGLKNPANKPTGFVGTYGVDLAPNADGFSLIAGSAAIDTGAALGSGYNGSINSIARPQGSAWDIGAYEYVPSGEPIRRPSPPTGLRIQTTQAQQGSVKHGSANE